MIGTPENEFSIARSPPRSPRQSLANLVGGGKSLMYQLPAVIEDSIVIVVSPLISLAKDQVDNWKNRGTSVDARAFNCTVPDTDKLRTIRDIACGESMILYTTPEALHSNEALRESIKVLT
jgi:superfamily II DNA helicase RecQ